MKLRKAVFPVGGLGTRFLPATKAMPKEMLPVVDKPLIQYAVEEAQEAGIEEFIFVTGRGKVAIENHFDHSYELHAILEGRGKTAELQAISEWMPPAGSVTYVRQGEPLGLGHAVWCARKIVGDEPFAVLLADDLILAETGCLKQMVALYERTGGNIVASMDVAREETKRYGIIDPKSLPEDAIIEVGGLVEKPRPEEAPSTAAVVGRYILQPSVFEHLSQFERGAGGEIQLTDALVKMIGEAPFHGLRFAGERFDCGDKVGFLKATIAFAMRRDDLAAGLRPYLQSLI